VGTTLEATDPAEMMARVVALSEDVRNSLDQADALGGSVRDVLARLDDA
jgi:hypothetical protein